MTLLAVRDLHTGYGRFPVVHGASLTVEEGEIVAIIGPNGAGKSSLLKAIFGVLPLLEGWVQLGGARISDLPAEQRPRLGMCLVPQSGNTFPDLTVEDNLRVSFSILPGDAVDRALERVFPSFPVLDERRRQRAKLLSGGERQMLALASAIGLEPRFLALDEPTSGLAPTIVAAVVEKIRQFRDAGSSILWVIEENPLEIMPYVDRVYVLVAGAIQAEMPAARITNKEDLQEIFFGYR